MLGSHFKKKTDCVSNPVSPTAWNHHYNIAFGLGPGLTTTTVATKVEDAFAEKDLVLSFHQMIYWLVNKDPYNGLL